MIDHEASEARRIALREERDAQERKAVEAIKRQIEIDRQKAKFEAEAKQLRQNRAKTMPKVRRRGKRSDGLKGRDWVK